MPARPLPKHLAQTKEEITTHTARSERSQRKDRWAVTIIIIFNRSIDQSSCCIEESLKNLQFPFKSLDLNLKLPPAACGAAGATNFHVFISRFHFTFSFGKIASIRWSFNRKVRKEMFSKILEDSRKVREELRPTGRKTIWRSAKFISFDTKRLVLIQNFSFLIQNISILNSNSP